MNIPEIKQVPTHDTPQSIPEAVFMEHHGGRLDHRSYRVGNAVWIAENARKYPVLAYPALQPALRDYAAARTHDKRERDTALNYRIGQWVWGVIQTMNENGANYELLKWARDICESENMTDRAAAIDRKLIQYAEANPPSEFSMIVESQKRDAANRQNQRTNIA